MANTLSIGTSPIRELDGLFSLNDLHTAVGDEPKHRRYLTEVQAGTPPTMQPLADDVLMGTPKDIANLILQHVGSPFTPEQVAIIVQHGSLRMMKELSRLKADTDIDQLKKQVCSLPMADLLEVATHAWMEASMRATQELKGASHV